jgi:hypothetical protein
VGLQYRNAGSHRKRIKELEEHINPLAKVAYGVSDIPTLLQWETSFTSSRLDEEDFQVGSSIQALMDLLGQPPPSKIRRVADLGAAYRNRTDDLRITRVFSCVAHGSEACLSFMFAGCC